MTIIVSIPVFERVIPMSHLNEPGTSFGKTPGKKATQPETSTYLVCIVAVPWLQTEVKGLAGLGAR